MPRWLTYDAAVATGELDATISKRGERRPDDILEEEWRRFQISKSPLLAADLMGRFMLAHDQRAQILAEFILRSRSCHLVTRRLAERILGQQDPSPESSQFAKIHLLKKKLAETPNNPAQWIDLARLYAVLHQDEHAKKAIRTALALAPMDRFCLRSAARFYIHINDTEAADELFRHDRSRLRDPWIFATATAVACWANKPSLLPGKKAIQYLIGKPSFSSSELLESIGMEEFSHGQDRMAKKAIRAALKHPASNAVSHAEWITRTYLTGLREAAVAHDTLSKPALAHSLFDAGKVAEAAVAAEEWILEEPYSSSPLVQASYIASMREDYAQVISYFARATKSRQLHPVLLNNFIFALLQMGNLKEASKVMANVAESTRSSNFALVATDGLLQLKLGNTQAGRDQYQKAYDIAANTDPAARSRVRLHMFLALAQQEIEYTDSEISELRSIAHSVTQTGEKILVDRLDKILKSKRETSSPQPETVTE